MHCCSPLQNGSAGPLTRARPSCKTGLIARARIRARPAKVRPSPLAHGSACARGSGPSQPGPGPPFLSPAWAKCSPIKRGTTAAARSRSTATRRSRAIKTPVAGSPQNPSSISSLSPTPASPPRERASERRPAATGGRRQPRWRRHREAPRRCARPPKGERAAVEVSLCGALARRRGSGRARFRRDGAGSGREPLAAGSPAVGKTGKIRGKVPPSPVGLCFLFSFASRVRGSRVALGCFRGSFLGFFSTSLSNSNQRKIARGD
jgi:hypothetical protein